MTHKSKRAIRSAWLGLVLGALLCPSAMGAPLPDRVGAWRLISEDVTPLVTETENLGRWTRLIYWRNAPRGELEVNLMGGSGPGRLRVPKAALDTPSGQAKEVMEAETEYYVLDVAGCRAVLERHEILPLCLAVSVSPDLSLTLESHAADEAELIDFAGRAVNALNGR